MGTTNQRSGGNRVKADFWATVPGLYSTAPKVLKSPAPLQLGMNTPPLIQFSIKTKHHLIKKEEKTQTGQPELNQVGRT